MPEEALSDSSLGQRMRYSQCGAKKVNTRPAWHTIQRPGMGG